MTMRSLLLGVFLSFIQPILVFCCSSFFFLGGLCDWRDVSGYARVTLGISFGVLLCFCWLGWVGLLFFLRKKTFSKGLTWLF